MKKFLKHCTKLTNVFKKQNFIKKRATKKPHRVAGLFLEFLKLYV